MSPSDSRVRTSHENPARLVQIGGTELLAWPALEAEGLDAVVTTRHGGVSRPPYDSLNLALGVGDDPGAVLENRRRALGALGADLGDLVLARQVHGAHASAVGIDDRGRGVRSTDDAVDGADALVTAEPGLVLGVLVADCAPVVLFDPVAGVLGCAHAGWRGALGGVLEAALGAMATLGAEPERVVVGVGPAVAATGYEVGPDVAEAAVHRLGEARACLVPREPGRWSFDLRGAVVSALEGAGVRPDHIGLAAADTGPPGPFFSARAEGTCGRFALLARIRP